ncbi:hypothetical protein K7W42_18210 [Deinococcus sp. HMF7604]|uniref:hypothetical protein n=1 Tax=Deinococcus betulae TaxID=2873312 RepID=UPI001CCAE623|nr:hypothetical protein [Deinococcus betulae]MBZ9752777.1 hypothetical protein [Deinococcus betulae]
MKQFWWSVAALGALSLSGAASAADVRLGLNSSLGLGCQVAGVRAGVQEGRLGFYGQAAFCLSNVEGRAGGAAFGVGASFDIFSTAGLTAYALLGGDVQNGTAVVHGGLGLRYGVPLVPVEAYVEAGVQRINTPLQAIFGPRLALGVNYKVNVANLQGTLPTAAPAGEVSSTGAPASCQLTPEQDAIGAQTTAAAAAESALSAAAGAYAAGFSNFSYKVTTTSSRVVGNSAVVRGSVTISLTSRSSGERITDTYSGIITLERADCGWVATGYSRE